MSDHKHSDGMDSLATHWSLISRARQSNPDERRVALAELLERYYPVLQSHLIVRKRLEPHHVDDLLQGFVAERILERNFLAQADRVKGKFRSLLFRSLENFVVDQFRHDRRFLAMGSIAGPAGDSSNDIGEAGSATPDIFDVSWARQVLAEAIQRMRTSCQQDARPWLWPLFDGRILQPTLTDQPPVGYDELVARFGFDSPAQASNALITVKRQFQRILESVVSEYLDETEDLATELADLRHILSHADAVDRDLFVGQVANLPIQPARQVENLPHETSSLKLVGIFDVTPDAMDHWHPKDLCALLRHQLAAPLRATLSSDERVSRKLSPPTDSTNRAEPQTFADLFQHPAPPLELLNAVKHWSKHSARQTKQPSFPVEIGTTLYYAALAAALVRHQQQISSSAKDALSDGFEMMLAQSWLTNELQWLFESARRELSE